MGVDRGRGEPAASAAGAQALAQLRFDAVEELVHARDQAFVLEHQRVAHHHARHAGVLLAELQQHHAMRCACSEPDSRSVIWLTSVKTLLSMNSIRPSNICALLAKWRYSAASLTLQPGGQRRGGDALGAGLLQHARQGLQDLHAAFARARALARGRRRSHFALLGAGQGRFVVQVGHRGGRGMGWGGAKGFWHTATRGFLAGKH
jgi:hypothetical protein